MVRMCSERLRSSAHFSSWRLTKLCRSFDLCEESGAYDAFFPKPRGALSGHYEEVSCSEWSGWDGDALWNGACLASESAGLWPSVSCGNTGMSFPTQIEAWLIYTLGEAPA